MSAIQEKIEQYSQEINAWNGENGDAESFRLKFLVAKGIVRELFDAFRSVSPQEKKLLGKELNAFKQLAEEKHLALQQGGIGSKKKKELNKEDLTLPGNGYSVGSRHPLSLVRKQIVQIFKSLGFVVAEGPEIEDDWHNFSALNFPEEHPARDMQDTYF